MPFHDQLRSIIVYAPIPLFAENLRVQRALVSAILTRHSAFSCLTGCVRDLERLWWIDDFELLGHFEGSQTKVVTSLRHGNTFQLANKAILDASLLIGRKSSKPMERAQAVFRETVVNVSFVTPTSNTVNGSSFPRRSWVCFFLVILEIAIGAVVAIFMALNGMIVGALLASCVCITTITLLVLRMVLNPIFGNMHAIAADQALTVAGGAALDVHVIADNWNSSRLDVICGYSSQLHSLTNIPARLNSPRTLTWSCRFLAIILGVQAALLASLTNSKDDNQWSALIWLSLYIMMALFEKASQQIYPNTLLEKQPASIRTLDTFHFSGRRAALMFIATLPVSRKADRWAWWDVFMPENDRRRALQTEFETFLRDAAGTEEKGTSENSGNKDQLTAAGTNTALLEVLAATHREDFVQYRQDFEKAVWFRPQTVKGNV